MQNNVNTSVERIIAKIDNDFNPDNSDWIPRVGAWCIDAMSIMNVLPVKTITKEFKVINRIIYFPYNINNKKKVKVYDSNGCEVKEAKTKCKQCNCNTSSTGEDTQSNIKSITNTVDIVYNEQANANSRFVHADTLNNKDVNKRTNVIGYNIQDNVEHNYVFIGSNKMELNFDTNCVTISYEGLETICSEEYGCELPAIPNNGKVIEAIAYFCVYKMLCRGYKHPVFNLNASQYGTNPYYIWTKMKDEARISYINNNVDDDVTKLFRSNFFITTFDTRN